MDLVKDSLSYNDKNQAGGRALRTPFGNAKYIQYQTNLNVFIQTKSHEQQKVLAIFKLETNFEDIFTSDEESAIAEQASIIFNRTCFELIAKGYKNIDLLAQKIRKRFSKNPIGSQTENYIKDRLPLLWALKYEPAIAATYLTTLDRSVLNNSVLFADRPEIGFSKEKSNLAENKDNLLEIPSELNSLIIEKINFFKTNPTIETIRDISREIAGLISTLQLEAEYENMKPAINLSIQNMLITMLSIVCADYEKSLYDDLSPSTVAFLASVQDEQEAYANQLARCINNFSFFEKRHTKDRPTLQKLIILQELKTELIPGNLNSLTLFKDKMETLKPKLEERRTNTLLAICTLGLSILIPMLFSKVKGEELTNLITESFNAFNETNVTLMQPKA